MPVLMAVTVFILMQLAGEAVVGLTGLPLPGALLGLLLLFAWFVWRGRVPRSLRDTAGYVLPHLMLLFIAPVAAVMLHFDRLASEWLAFMLSCLVGAMLTVWVTALTFGWMMRRDARRQKGRV